jgi:hypothetical protein
MGGRGVGGWSGVEYRSLVGGGGSRGGGGGGGGGVVCVVRSCVLFCFVVVRN